MTPGERRPGAAAATATTATAKEGWHAMTYGVDMRGITIDIDVPMPWLDSGENPGG